MTQAPAAIVKIPTTGTGEGREAPAEGEEGPTRRPEPCPRERNGRAATSGDGEVIELECGITVYPARCEGGRWRAVWHEDGQRQQCEAATEDKLTAKRMMDDAVGGVRVQPVEHFPSWLYGCPFEFFVSFGSMMPTPRPAAGCAPVSRR